MELNDFFPHNSTVYPKQIIMKGKLIFNSNLNYLKHQ